MGCGARWEVGGGRDRATRGPPTKAPPFSRMPKQRPRAWEESAEEGGCGCGVNGCAWPCMWPCKRARQAGGCICHARHAACDRVCWCPPEMQAAGGPVGAGGAAAFLTAACRFFGAGGGSTTLSPSPSAGACALGARFFAAGAAAAAASTAGASATTTVCCAEGGASSAAASGWLPRPLGPGSAPWGSVPRDATEEAPWLAARTAGARAAGVHSSTGRSLLSRAGSIGARQRPPFAGGPG